MSARLPIETGVFFLTALFAAAPCWAAPAASLDHVAPSLNSIDNAAHQFLVMHCNTPECRALVAIATVLRIDLDATASTVGVPTPILPDRSPVGAALDEAVLGHPDRFQAVCAVGGEIISRYSVPGIAGEVFVPVNLLRLALAMDERGGTRCLADLLVRLPRSPAAQTAIHNARTLCANTDDAADAPKHCGAITSLDLVFRKPATAGQNFSF